MKIRPQQALAVACLASPLLAQQPALQVDWIQNPSNGSWYGVDHALRTWQDQQAVAEGIGGNLVTIRSQDEHDWLISNLFTTYALGGALHIGASDATQEGTWTWASGEPFSFTRWDPGQPDNFGGNQDYGVLSWNYGGNWDDGDGSPRRGIFETTTRPQVGWSWPRVFASGVRPHGCCLTDVDADGDLDFISTIGEEAFTSTPDAIGVYLNNGLGEFSPSDLKVTEAEPYRVEAHDCNLDGLPDIVYSALGGSLGWMENLGSGAFADPIPLASGGVFTGIAISDVTGDQVPDFVAVRQSPSEVVMLPGVSTGGFGGLAVLYANPARLDPLGLNISDLDGDGDLDLVVGYALSQVVTLLENDGAGSFIVMQELGTGASPRQQSMGDLNNDGAPDVVVPCLGSNTVEVWLGSASNIWTQVASIPAGAGPHSSTLADLNNDGALDIVVPCYASDDVWIMMGDGAGAVGATYRIADQDYAISCLADDVDGDGAPDLLVNRHQAASFSVWINNCDFDCNANGIVDSQDISTGSSLDCNENGIPDECDIANGLDCNGNGIPDSCDIASGFALDCNNNGIPDDCDIANDPTVDANLNSVPDSCEVAGSRYWILSPVTGNWYAVTDQLEADDAAQMAVNLGGDLVTINSQAENDWLSDQFGDINNPFWIGLNDVAVEGQYAWLSGEPVTYTNWRAGQPDDAPGLFGADFAVLTPPLGTWNDEPNDASTFVNLPRGVVELASSDCDGNGLPDTFELLQDPSLDCDGNGVHDFCDLQDPALDCDGDGVLDSCQIAADPSLDCDGNGAIDSCEILADVSLDCDANQFLDSCQIANDPSLDWNGDGLLDTCAGGSIVYCVSNGNATGLRGLTQPLGSPVIADDAFSIRAYNLPIGQPGMFIMSRTTGLVNPFGGGAGVLCLGPPIRRFGPNDGFALQFSNAAGEIILSPPIGAFPGPNPVQPGEVLHFQLWHRENDPVTGAPRSNTSEGISVMFR